MSTTASTQQSDRPIYHPLDRLRGTIRRFVVMDGLLVAGLLAVIAFWCGLILDYGAFRLAQIDWVQDAPWGLRLIILLIGLLILIGLLVARVVLRMNREFSYPALALVLEKRFPQVLGDRLITAVELADVQQMSQYGYSEQMIRQTIDEARERVDQVPMETVFNWHRLWWQGFALVGVIIGGVIVAFVGHSAYARSASPGTFAWQFGDVVTIWGERNLLLLNTPWPRHAHLELVGFDGEELRIGKDAPAPTIRVRAVEWVIADRETREGWRPLRYSDLTILGISSHTATENQPTGDTLVDALFPSASTTAWGEELLQRARSAAMSRTVRKLEIPTNVILSYRGEKTGGTVSLTRDPSGIFSGDITDLKESIRFVVRGADFATAPRRVTLLPPPMLPQLTRTEYQPAYLYHPAPYVGEDVSALRPDWERLKGLRQVFADRPLSLTGDRSVFSIPAGSGVVLTGSADKPLKAVRLRYKAGKPEGAPDEEDVPVSGDTFTIAFQGQRTPTQTLEFELTLFDEDQVTAKRAILIQVAEDQPPQVEMTVEVLRRQGNVYLCTPMARVPFIRESVVRDDNGLSQVEFEYTVTPVESPAVFALQRQSAAGLWAMAPVWPNLGVAIGPAVSATSVGQLGSGAKKQFGRANVLRFTDEFARLPKSTPETLVARLTATVDRERPDVVRQIKFEDPDLDGFDFEQVLPNLRSRLAGEIQPRYRVELNVVATDTNVETGPKTGRNVEIVRLLVISEQDLLAEISKDEESQIARLDELIQKLEAARSKLNQVSERMANPAPAPDIIVSSAVRTLDVLQDVGKARDATNAVVTEYTRIRREAEVNRCNRSVITKWDEEVLGPLPQILQTEFPTTEQTISAVQSPLAAGQRPETVLIQNAQSAISALIQRLKAVREKLGDVVSINKLRDELRRIIEDQKSVSQALDRSKRRIVDNLFNPQLLPVPPITLAKGEKKTLTQPVDWKIFADDSLQVKVEASAGSDLKVPAVLKVSADNDSFTYDVTAGQKTGEFTMTLTPSVGAPLTVKVTVK
ncbi:MAG: hypothetical protein LC104_18115 [Bacteroidales bacterium]|nr:hypothetical protein [Bacteroidales bacterium]